MPDINDAELAKCSCAISVAVCGLLVSAGVREQARRRGQTGFQLTTAYQQVASSECVFVRGLALSFLCH